MRRKLGLAAAAALAIGCGTAIAGTPPNSATLQFTLVDLAPDDGVAPSIDWRYLGPTSDGTFFAAPGQRAGASFLLSPNTEMVFTGEISEVVTPTATAGGQVFFTGHALWALQPSRWVWGEILPVRLMPGNAPYDVTTPIAFSFVNSTSVWQAGNISMSMGSGPFITFVPEPGPAVMLASALLAFGSLRLRARKDLRRGRRFGC